MTQALRLDARSLGANRTAVSLPRDRYTVVGKLRGSGRAELSLCLPRGAEGVGEVVLVKTFAAGVLGRTAGAPPDELDLASRLHHENIVRTLGSGQDDGTDFIVTEYLEGITLQRLLEWLRAHDEQLSDAVVARVLLALCAAVEHAIRCAVTAANHVLVNQVVAAEDVFITCQGDVKLLGFKAASGIPGAGEARYPAIDALLSTQRSPELGALLGRLGARLSPSSVLGLWQVARALQAWQEQSLGSNGRAELASVMAKLLPDGRATRRAHLEAACTRVRRLQRAREAALVANGPGSDGEAAAEDAAPVSGFRMTGASSSRAAGSEAIAMPPALPPEPVDASEAVPLEPALPVRVEPALPVRVEPALLVRVEPASLVRVEPAPLVRVEQWTGSHRPLAVDITAHGAQSSRWPWLAAAMVFGAAAAFGANHALRSPASVAIAAPRAAEPLPPVPGAAVPEAAVPEAPVPAEVKDLPPSATRNPEAPASEAAAAPSGAGLRGAAGRWTLPVSERQAGNEPAGSAPVMARGYLTLDTAPPSLVSLGGVSLGRTPLVKVELPAGQHVLALANPELGISSSAVVDIVAGVTMVRHVGLEWSAAAVR